MDATNQMRTSREEVFGPVANVIRVRDDDEALAVANDTPTGLVAGIATRSLKYATHFRRHAQAGMVMVNLPLHHGEDGVHLRRLIHPGASMEPLADNTLALLRTVSTATLCTQLFKRGFGNVFLQGVSRLTKSPQGNLMGPAFTVRKFPAREDLDELAAFKDPNHPQRRSIESIPAGHVMGPLSGQPRSRSLLKRHCSWCCRLVVVDEHPGVPLVIVIVALAEPLPLQPPIVVIATASPDVVVTGAGHRAI